MKKFLHRLKTIGFSGFSRLYNALLGRRRPGWDRSDLLEWNEIVAHAEVQSDINDHLPTLFIEALTAQPKLIVELGVRRGESTFVFERVARLTDAYLVSVDIAACTAASSYPRWFFVQSDDVSFAQQFPEWCARHGIAPSIDCLFVDTSHRFDHTLQEIDAWFPYLSANAIVFFHDTNSKRLCYKRDGSLYPILNPGCGREVIQALEQHFATRFDEAAAFTRPLKGWIIQHHPYCYGLTILRRIPSHLQAGSPAR